MSVLEIRRSEWLAGLFIILLGVALWVGVDLRESGDDVGYREVLDRFTLLEFSRYRYTTWSGRVILDAINVVTIRHPLLFKTGIALSFLLMCYQIYRLTLRETLAPCAGTLLAAGMVLLMPASVSQWGGWWVTGFYNYLLPLMLGLFAFRYLWEKYEHGWLYQALAVVAAVVACQQEQVAVSLLLAVAVLAACRLSERQRIGPEALVLAAGTLSAAVLFAAPGNQLRLASEISWLPEFGRFGLLDKLTLGLDRVNAHANDNDNRLFLLAMLSSIALLYMQRERWRMKPLATLVLGGGVTTLLVSGAGLPVSAKLTFSGPILPGDWRSLDVFVAFAKTMVLYGTLAVCAVYFSRRRLEWVAGVGVLALVFAMTLVLGFSPTVYGSGARIFYVSDVLLAIYVCYVNAHIVGQLRLRMGSGKVEQAS